MGCEPDQWARDWLEERRRAGERGLTVEKVGGSHYLKRATTRWDPELKKRRKESEYLGRLNPDGTVGAPRPRREHLTVLDVRDGGSARVLARAAAPVIGALREHFPREWPEIALLAFARVLGRGELCRAGRCWKGLEDVLGASPSTSPKALGEALERIGGARGAQDAFFAAVRGREGSMAVDLSACFSRSEGATILKRGYNRYGLARRQFNILLACGVPSGRPQYAKVLAGNVGERSIEDMLDEFDVPRGTTLVMDRGYCKEGVFGALRARGLDWIVPARRDSRAYGAASAGDGLFAWKGCAVRFGSAPWNGMRAYRFENVSAMNDELVDRAECAERSGGEPLDDGRAGNMVLLSSLDLPPREVYAMMKKRCEVEQCYDAAKNVLGADRAYMRGDLGIMGHCFVTFVALCIWAEIDSWIEAAGLGGRHTPADVLDIYASAKTVTVGGAELRQSVGRDVIDLDAKLGLWIYSDPPAPRRGRGRPRKDGGGVIP
ncbi:MAG: transposase [Candidatus Methanoplasma sp.]|jgi:hypothetical protein|nr:transposase [Candidatus Methanoplasma sp.]